MKKYFSLLIMLFIVTGAYLTCQAQSKSLSATDSIKLKAKELQKLYSFAAHPSDIVSDVFKQKFFDAFPNTFKELDELYGYHNHTPSILYYEGMMHLKLFDSLCEIVGDTIYYRKIISIAIGGHWDADAINYFQQGLRDQVLAKPELVIYLLKKMGNKQIKSFWYFYFDGPIPPKTIPEKLSVIKEADTHMYSLMEATLKEVQQSWKDK